MPTRIIILLHLLLTPIVLLAQETRNYLNLDEATYSWYTDMAQHVFLVDNIRQADSVLRVARQRGDVAAEIAALQVKSLGTYATGKLDSCLMVIDEFANTALRNIEREGVRRYYYLAMQLKVNIGMMTEDKFGAFKTAQEMLRQSAADHDDFGTYCSYFSMALVYEMRSNFSSALTYYKRCIEWGQSHPNANATLWQVRVHIADCYRCLNMDSEAHRNGALAIEEAVTDDDKTRAEAYNLLFAFYGESPEDYIKRYQEISSRSDFVGMTDYTVQQFSKIHFYKACGEKNNALRLADSLNADERLRARTEIFCHFGMWEEAHRSVLEQQAFRDSIQGAVMSEDLERLDAELNNAILREQNTKANAHVRNVWMCSILALVLIVLLSLYILAQRRLRHVRQLEVLNTELDNANQMKTRFIQNISHEIRTPLNAVTGFSQLMTMDSSLSDEERRDLANRINIGTNQITRIVDEMLDISELESTGFQMERAETSINGICQEALDHARPYLQNAVELRFETDFADADTVFTDRRRVVQSLKNILTNACEHTQTGHVTLSASKSETPGMLKYTITDTGVGIPADKADMIFSAFEKLDDFKVGAGLGLSICKMIATLLDGDVNLDRSYTSGARIIFEINGLKQEKK